MTLKDEERVFTEEELKEKIEAKLEEEKKVWEAQKRFEDLEKLVGTHKIILKDHEERIAAGETEDSETKKQIKEIHQKLVAVDSKPKKFWSSYKEFIQNFSGTLTLILVLGGTVTGFVLWAVQKPVPQMTSPTVGSKP